ncbi:glycosyltransferase family protein [Hippea jasoniae]|uniref:hypothetical protein n=1 Tax=Hippea jasoniae TaxID=944479 RepID=UPI000555905C|nr:hypothetical protein [Hippea jasoniae]
MNKNSILFINYYFPPVKAVGSIGNYKIAKGFLENNWNVYIISTAGCGLNKDYSCYSEIRADKKCYNIDGKYILKIFNVLKSKLFKASNIYSKKEKNDIKHKESILNSHLSILYEGNLFYIIQAIYYSIFYIKKYNIEYIFTSYSPLADHILGLILKEIFPNLKWIAHFRDLRITNDNKSKVDLKIERTILKKANVVTGVSKGILDELNNIFPTNKYFILRNCIDKIYIDTQEKTKNDKFKIIYTGKLYAGKRNFNVLLKAINKLPSDIKKNIQLIYAGGDSELFKNLLIRNKIDMPSINIVTYNNLTWKSSIELQSNADLLLLLTWSYKGNKGILTGKLFEYLMHEKPILGIVNGEKDKELEEIWNKGNLGLLVYNKNEYVDLIVDFIIKLYLLKNRESWKYKTNYINNFYCSNMVGKFIKNALF